VVPVVLQNHLVVLLQKPPAVLLLNAVNQPAVHLHLQLAVSQPVVLLLSQAAVLLLLAAAKVVAAVL
jgi:hypothetical protein